MNILIIGLGSISKKHIASIQNVVKKPRIFGLRSNKLKSGKIKGVKNIFDFNELPKKIDFTIISNPSHLHYGSIIDSLNLNCPLFIEKPVLSTIKNSSYISGLIKKKGILTYVACNLRFHPLIKLLKKKLNNKIKQINQVNVYCGSFLPNWRKNNNYRKSYSSDPAMGGGVHLDLIHELDYCIWIFGKPLRLYVNKRSVSTLDIKSIDSALYILEYENYNVNINLNYFRVDSKREIEVLLDNDTLIGDLLKNSLKSMKMNKIIYSGNYEIMDTYVSQMKHFTENLSTGNRIMNDFDEALSILKLCLNE